MGSQTPDADAQAFRHRIRSRSRQPPAPAWLELPLRQVTAPQGTGRVHAELPAHHVQPRDGSGGVPTGLLQLPDALSNDFSGDAGLSAGDKEDSRTRMVMFRKENTS